MACPILKDNRSNFREKAYGIGKEKNLKLNKIYKWYKIPTKNIRKII